MIDAGRASQLRSRGRRTLLALCALLAAAAAWARDVPRISPTQDRPLRAVGPAAEEAAPASPVLPTAARLEQEIRAGAKALLAAIHVDVRVRYRGAVTGGGRVQTAAGRLIQRSAKELRIQTEKGELRIPAGRLVRVDATGTIEPDLFGPNSGGLMSLAAFALLTAGVDAADPHLAALLTTLETHPMPGTYGRSLRAAAWALRCEQTVGRPERVRYRRLLNDDVRWLLLACRTGAAYDYTKASDRSRGRTDNSVTQFAHLGMAAADDAPVEIPSAYWSQVEQHWIGSQQPDGGWKYDEQEPFSKPSMTVAGANSLYLVLDHRYTRLEPRYKRFKGSRSPARFIERRSGVYDALHRADEYLRRSALPMREFDGYNLFGLERLGVTSGNAFIGGQEWYGAHVDDLLGRTWSDNVIADSFALIFLVHGRAPIWIQELAWGGDPARTHPYGRDLHFATKFLNQVTERRHRWQNVPESADLATLLAAPILYLSGPGAMTLPRETRDRIRGYADAGGSILLHADYASDAFTRSAREMFEDLFSDRRWTFHDLPADHPVYRCQFGRGGEWPDRPPLLGLGPAGREKIILCPVDVAGAWHQNRVRSDRDLFELMINLRVYLAPPYEALPFRPAAPAPAN